MRTVAFFFLCLACAGHGRRVQKAVHQMREKTRRARQNLKPSSSLKQLATLLTTRTPTAAWQAAGLDAPAHHLSASPCRSSRAGDVELLQAWDLPTTLNCIQSGSFQNFQACLDASEPWLSVTATEKFISPRFMDALTGATFTAIPGLLFFQRFRELRTQEVMDRLKCIYCEGTGRIASGSGSGSVVCINCQGSGRQVPEEVFNRLGDEEQGFTKEHYVGLFDHVPAGSEHKSKDDKSEKPVSISK
mmetsp:Transcript_88491/g.162494  ORF Transcript_88491/g.162494 Transcript_88491/m.162494 type:complete len:246 (-) Transcript_88491:71-808(-)